MSDAEKQDTQTDPGREKDAETPQPGGIDTASAGDDAIRQVTAERDDLRDRLLRLAAEMENLRRRTEREVKEAAQYAVTSFARDMLTVGDNLQRALAAVTAEQRESAGEGLEALINGVEMTAREMQNVLERHGMKKIEPAGEKFDPNFHQAMFEVADDSVPGGTVREVIQAGYTIHGRVLRPALVGVAKGNGGGKAADSPEAAADAGVDRRA